MVTIICPPVGNTLPTGPSGQDHFYDDTVTESDDHAWPPLRQPERGRAPPVLPGATHEDPAFMRTQWEPTLAFLDRVFHV
jgi:hypothetical protein